MGSALRFVVSHWKLSVLGAVLLYVGLLHLQLDSAREARVNSELREDSAVAAADSTREVLTEAFQSNVRFFQRRIVQVREMTADSVEEELESDPRFRGSLTAQVDSLVVNQPGVTTENDGVRTATFVGYREPYEFHAEVVVPPPEGPDPVMRLRVNLDSIPLTVRVGCGEPIEGRTIRPAQATVEGPEWADLRMDALRQSAEVCNPEIRDSGGLPWWSYVAGGIALGVGATIAF